VSIIRLGRTVETGTLTELRHLTRTAITVETAEPITDVTTLPGVHDAVVNRTHGRFDVDAPHLDAVMRRLSQLGIRSITSSPPTLEEMFLRHYGDNDTDTGDTQPAPAADPA
jgi:ABC-2 type transport system ATP-binding protein